MRGGRNRKPLRLRVLQGTARPARRRNTPKPRPIAPSWPSWLNGEARREWQRVAPKLTALGLLTELDRTALTAFCVAWAHLREAEAAVQRDGLTVPGYRGAPRKHPALTVINQATQQLRAWALELGLTPSARSRLDLPPPEDDDAEDDLD